MTIQCVKDGKVILEIKAHTAVICPRSKDFTRLLEFDIQVSYVGSKSLLRFRLTRRIRIDQTLLITLGGLKVRAPQ